MRHLNVIMPYRHMEDIVLVPINFFHLSPKSDVILRCLEFQIGGESAKDWYPDSVKEMLVRVAYLKTSSVLVKFTSPNLVVFCFFFFSQNKSTFEVSNNHWILFPFNSNNLKCAENLLVQPLPQLILFWMHLKMLCVIHVPEFAT